MESGTDVSLWSVNPPESNPENYIRQVAEELDCYDDDSFVMMDCLRELPWRQVDRGNFSCTVSRLKHVYFFQAVDSNSIRGSVYRI